MVIYIYGFYIDLIFYIYTYARVQNKMKQQGCNDFSYSTIIPFYITVQQSSSSRYLLVEISSNSLGF